MASVADLVEPNLLASLTIPSNYRLCQEIAANNSVEFLAFGPTDAKARITNGQTRHVTLQSVDNALQWDCTCTSKRDKRCKHVVATALTTWDKAPKRNTIPNDMK